MPKRKRQQTDLQRILWRLGLIIHTVAYALFIYHLINLQTMLGYEDISLQLNQLLFWTPWYVLHIVVHHYAARLRINQAPVQETEYSVGYRAGYRDAVADMRKESQTVEENSTAAYRRLELASDAKLIIKLEETSQKNGAYH